MGDRANIKFKESEKNSIYFYTHWDGYKLPLVLQAALKRKQRWEDPQYLSRIIFCEMVKDDVGGETGYGISVEMGDGSGLIEVNPEKQTVLINDTTWSFGQYIELSKKDIEAVYNAP